MRSVVVPEGLAAMPPGPALSAVLAGIPLACVPNDEVLTVQRAQYRQLCHEQARMAAVVAEVGRCAGFPEPGQVLRNAAAGPYASEESRAALMWTRRCAEGEHDLAESVVHGLPVVFAAWWAGELDRARVVVFDRYLGGLVAEQVEAICRVVVPRASGLTTGQLAVVLRRMVIAVDPEAAERWYRAGIAGRDVIAHLSADGTVVLCANGLPADQAEGACLRVQNLAAAARRAGHPGLIGQIRCDLFLGLLDGRFHHMNATQIIAALLENHQAHLVSGEDDRTGQAAPGANHSAAPGHAESTDLADRADPAHTAGTADPAHTAAVDERVGIEVRVALGTLLGLDEHPGEIPGLGLLPAIATRARVAAQRRAQWRFAVTDDTGRLITEGITRRRPASCRRDGPPGGIVELHIPTALLAELVDELAAEPKTTRHSRLGEWAGLITDIAAQYARRDSHLTDLDAHPTDRLPTAALRRHTEIRDRTCVFTGCRHRASSADLDHTHDHATGGISIPANLGPVCRHDHRVKHIGGWQLTQPEPGTFHWRSPLGATYRTRGEFLHPMPEPTPGRWPTAAALSRSEAVLTTDDRPILWHPVRQPPSRRNETKSRADGSDKPPPF